MGSAYQLSSCSCSCSASKFSAKSTAAYMSTFGWPSTGQYPVEARIAAACSDASIIRTNSGLADARPRKSLSFIVAINCSMQRPTGSRLSASIVSASARRVIRTLASQPLLPPRWASRYSRGASPCRHSGLVCWTVRRPNSSPTIRPNNYSSSRSLQLGPARAGNSVRSASRCSLDISGLRASKSRSAS